MKFTVCVHMHSTPEPVFRQYEVEAETFQDIDGRVVFYADAAGKHPVAFFNTPLSVTTDAVRRVADAVPVG